MAINYLFAPSMWAAEHFMWYAWKNTALLSCKLELHIIACLFTKATATGSNAYNYHFGARVKAIKITEASDD